MTGMELTLKDLSELEINLDVAREAHDQSSKMLTDVLDTKKVFEQKAFTLFTGYITALLAVLGVAAIVYRDHGLTAISIAFAVCGVALVVGVVCVIQALLDRPYGALGSTPSLWLRRGIIDGAANSLPAMLAYVTFFMDARIEQGLQSNATKAKWIRRGIFCGAAAPVMLILAIVVLKLAIKTLS